METLIVKRSGAHANITTRLPRLRFAPSRSRFVGQQPIEMNMKATMKSTLLFGLTIVPGMIISGLLAALFLNEWFTISVIADPEMINSYDFGSEAMVGNSGWHYRTAELYSRTALIEALIALVVTGMFLFAAIRKSKQEVAVAYGLTLAYIAAIKVIL